MRVCSILQCTFFCPHPICTGCVFFIISVWIACIVHWELTTTAKSAAAKIHVVVAAATEAAAVVIQSRPSTCKERNILLNMPVSYMYIAVSLVPGVIFDLTGSFRVPFIMAGALSVLGGMCSMVIFLRQKLCQRQSGSTWIARHILISGLTL